MLSIQGILTEVENFRTVDLLALTSSSNTENILYFLTKQAILLGGQLFRAFRFSMGFLVLSILFICATPGACTIKLFTDVIY